MNNKFNILIIVILTIILVSCKLCIVEYACQKPIDLEKVDYILITNQTNDSSLLITKRLAFDQSEILIDKWNNASTIGPCIYLLTYKIDVYFKDKTKRNFRVNGKTIKEENDWGFNFVDSNFVENLWMPTK